MGSKGDGGWLSRKWRKIVEPWQTYAGQLALIVAFFLLVTVAAFLMWRRFGPTILARTDYAVKAEHIHIPRQPEWVQGDVRSESIVLGSLEDMWIHQEQLAPRIAAAFKLHPWVRKVRHVGKAYPPAKVTVDLEYRQPIALVVVPKGFYAVDVEGVLLPPEGFIKNPDEPKDGVLQLPHIIAKDLSPIGRPGFPWGDPQVHGAARIAAMLRTRWTRLGLHRIIAQPSNEVAFSSQQPVFELRTRKGTSIMWGHAPGEEIAGEARAASKIRKLTAIFDQKATLDILSPGETIDLRHGDRQSVARRQDVGLK